VNRAPRSERGMTLLISLIMLVMITLFVVSMVRLSNTNVAVVGNMQAQRGVEAEAQQAIEIAVSKFSFFNDAILNQGGWAANLQSMSYASLWTSYTPAGAGPTTPPGIQSNTITIFRPQCSYFEPTSGYSALSGVAPQDTYWDLQISAQDSFIGATTEVHQGIEIRQPAGNCP
jgi:hypothetical protein